MLAGAAFGAILLVGHDKHRPCLPIAIKHGRLQAGKHGLATVFVREWGAWRCLICSSGGDLKRLNLKR